MKIKRCFYLVSCFIILAACGNKSKNSDAASKDSTNSTSHNDNMNDQMTNPDEDFVMEAGEGGLFEVMAGELAVKKGSAKVKQLGQMMVDDHSKANADLKKIARDKNMSVPGSLGNDLQKKYDNLMAKDGKEFDKMYANMMVEDHKKDIEKFKKEANNGKDEDFKKFASEKLPTLEHHLEMSKETKKHCDSR